MFGSQLIWNGIPFGAIAGANSFMPVQHFSMSSRIKVESDEETGITKTTGRELQECSFSIRCQKFAGTDPRAVFALLDALKGQSSGIYLAQGVAATLSLTALNAIQTSDWRKLLTLENAISLAKSLVLGAKIGGCEFMLTAVNMEAVGITSKGDIYDAVITLSLTEKASQSLTGGLRVFYNDNEITEKIQIASCVYEMFAEGASDSIDITFTDVANEWNDWKPSAQGDTIRITDGAIDSGRLYLDSLNPQKARYRIKAFSAPKTAYSIKSRSFASLSLPQLANKIAEDNGLSVKLHDVPETQIVYTQQVSKSDLAFLQESCMRSGVSFVIFDGCLCLYGQQAREKSTPTKNLVLSSSDKISVSTDAHAAYASCELRNGTYTGIATDETVKTGKIHRATVQSAWGSQADANAEAKASLRALNKYTSSASLDMSLQRQLAAGSVISLEADGWSGPAFIYRLRHDLHGKRSAVWIRKPLTY